MRVRASLSYARKVVRIQRLSSRGVWVTTMKVRLNRFGQKAFTARFPRGKTRARAWVGATPGYTAGFSTTRIIQR